MVEDTHDRLLSAAIEAYYKYENDVKAAKDARTKAFADALRGPVTGREIAAALGISPGYVSRISRGER